jgi:predicted small lipoprotein YifL
MIVTLYAAIASLSACAAAGPIVLPRTVTALDEASFEEAQQADTTATKAFSNTQIQVNTIHLSFSWACLTFVTCRLPMADVSSLTSCRATSEPT